MTIDANMIRIIATAGGLVACGYALGIATMFLLAFGLQAVCDERAEARKGAREDG